MALNVVSQLSVGRAILVMGVQLIVFVSGGGGAASLVVEGEVSGSNQML